MNRGAVSQGSSSDSQPWALLQNPVGILEHRSRRPHLRTEWGNGSVRLTLIFPPLFSLLSPVQLHCYG